MAPEPPRVVLEMTLGLVKALPPGGKAPRLLVAGAKDPFLPLPRAQALAENLGARLSVLPEYPHALFMEDETGLVKRLLLEFLQNCP
jgi:pimeloyl-ACP methyl ester carboxylesterase